MNAVRKIRNYSSIFVIVMVSICLNPAALADKLEAANSTAPISSASLSVRPGTAQADRLALLNRIQQSKEKGVGIQNYMLAFQYLESMVDKGASQEKIQAYLNSINARLNQQLSAIDQQSAKQKSAKDLGIVGFKFVIASQRIPEISKVFSDTPAAQADLRKGDSIMEVDGIPTTGLNKDEIYGMLVGQPNTTVKIKFSRGDATLVKMLTRMKLQDLSRAHPDIVEAYLMAQ